MRSRRLGLARPGAREAASCLIVVAFVLGCETKSPTRPGPATIEGTLTLRGTLRDPTGTVTGSRVVSAPNGILVYLSRSGAIVDSALTVAGKYSFSLENGSYQLQVRTGPLILATLDITIDAQIVFLRIPSFEMTSGGGLEAFPNPFVTELDTRYALANASTVDLGVFDLANRRVRTLVVGANHPAGVHMVHWDGLDDASQPVADAAYWIVFSGDGRTAAELAFKEP